MRELQPLADSVPNRSVGVIVKLLQRGEERVAKPTGYALSLSCDAKLLTTHLPGSLIGAITVTVVSSLYMLASVWMIVSVRWMLLELVCQAGDPTRCPMGL
jgi:hypothetical protein